MKNVIGATVFTATDFKQHQVLDIREAASGVYFVQVIQNGKMNVFKVLKE